MEAVRGVSFEIAGGEVFGFLGPNGAGKTTTMRMLGTLLSPSSGTGVVAGHDVVRDPSAVRRAIGFALQEAGLARYSTGREHLHLMGRLHGLSRAETRVRADELLELFELTDAADRQVRTYSGGMKRRIDLACGLVHRPRLLFLDEPSTGVDPASRAALWSELVKLRDSGVSLFLTTHYLEEADRLCERLAIVDRGVIVAEGTPDELKAGIGADVVTVTVDQAEVVAARAALEALGRVRAPEPESVSIEAADGAGAVVSIVERLGAAGIRPRTVMVARPTLDDVFLLHTGATIEGRETEGGAEAESEAAA
ncbi:MAG TPA: ATP-binding cassette domain-containing protein [Gaiellales bacterium]|nr:ATP-binding cassette domain-containing protein [Gaiellales bacterium]